MVRDPEKKGLAGWPVDQRVSERRMGRSQGTGIREGSLNVEKRQRREREGQI